MRLDDSQLRLGDGADLRTSKSEFSDSGHALWIDYQSSYRAASLDEYWKSIGKKTNKNSLI